MKPYSQDLRERIVKAVDEGFSRSEIVNPFCSAPSFFGGYPGIGFGARLPVSRRSLRYRLIVASDTPKSLTISLREKPSSTAFTIRSLKSWEYGFISHLIFSMLTQPLPDEDAPSSFMDGIKTPSNRCKEKYLAIFKYSGMDAYLGVERPFRNP